MNTMVSYAKQLMLILVILFGLYAQAYNPILPTPPPAITQPWNIVEFRTYTDPDGRYSLSIPVKATIDSTNAVTTFTYSDTHIMRGSYVVEVEIIPHIDAASPTDFLKQITETTRSAPIQLISANNGAPQGARTTYDLPSGNACPDLKGTIAGFMHDNQGYLLRIEIDAVEHCDLERATEINNTIKSVRIPASPQD